MGCPSTVSCYPATTSSTSKSISSSSVSTSSCPSSSSSVSSTTTTARRNASICWNATSISSSHDGSHNDDVDDVHDGRWRLQLHDAANDVDEPGWPDGRRHDAAHDADDEQQQG